jgi:hypothetical protein
VDARELPRLDPPSLRSRGRPGGACSRRPSYPELAGGPWASDLPWALLRSPAAGRPLRSAF